MSTRSSRSFKKTSSRIEKKNKNRKICFVCGKGDNYTEKLWFILDVTIGRGIHPRTRFNSRGRGQSHGRGMFRTNKDSYQPWPVKDTQNPYTPRLEPPNNGWGTSRAHSGGSRGNGSQNHVYRQNNSIDIDWFSGFMAKIKFKSSLARWDEKRATTLSSTAAVRIISSTWNMFSCFTPPYRMRESPGTLELIA